jgi:hypothetical protein
LLDNVIALNERHLKRLLSDYISYHPRIEPISDSARRRPAAESQTFLAAESLRGHDSEASGFLDVCVDILKGASRIVGGRL